MNTPRRNLFAILDNALRWTGVPARVAEDLSGAPRADRQKHPHRWSPIWMIALACALFVFSLTWPLAPLLSALAPSLGAVLVSMTPLIYQSGPLGKPSIEDDEREAALRKDSFLFCLGLLAFLNSLGQPALMIWSHLRNWQLTRSMLVAVEALMLNATLFGCLPTLYASWSLPRLPPE